MRRIVLQLLVAVICGPRCAPAVELPVRFNRDIRPILSENCFQCHGFDEKARQGELRLDTTESALVKSDEVTPIVPGHPDQSEVWRRITTDDESEIMPPPDSHRRLKPSQKELIKRWIEQGAKYEKHWSFIPPVKVALPQISEKKWPRNEIDNFILERLEGEKLPHTSEADRRTLIRRLALDLTGLPPTALEVEAFVRDKSPDAYEKLVDRLLASPHFGERMALVWLDAARYADTNGFSADGGRHMWLWRDWVINAFNTNMPYDEFIRQQLAGDLLPNRTDNQLVATGFQRNNMNTHEVGTIPEENLTNYNVDRVKTLGESVLGLTLGCCQCHDHKYDPITQKDYYQVYAYFNTLSDVALDGDGGINSRPSYEAKTIINTGEEPALRSQIDALCRKLANPKADDVAQWEKQQRDELKARGANFELHPVELLKLSSGVSSTFEFDLPRFVHVTTGTAFVPYDVSIKLPKVDKPLSGVRVIFYQDDTALFKGRGYGVFPSKVPPEQQKGTFVLTSFSASADQVPGDQVDLNRLLDLSRVTADSWLVDFAPAGVIDTRSDDGWSPVPGDGPTHITTTFAKPVDTTATPYMTVQLNFGRGIGLIPARFEILAMTGMDDGSPLPADMIDIVQAPADKRTPEQQKKLLAYYIDHADATKRDRIELTNLKERLDVITKKFSTMVMDISEKPRETFILHRGDYAQPTEKVSAGTPAVLPPLPAGAPANRLGLAQWITMREHPLTARVEVNRLWQVFFGTGIVATAADFGAQGQFPSHPDLLDWLAVDFMDNGWDVKRLIKQIVISATYRQSSSVAECNGESDSRLGDTRLQQLDPNNRLLARGPRFRLPAEFIRDQALQVSGLLVDRLGGPSVNPYTPGNLWREVSVFGVTPATAQTFEQDHGEKLYRRSLYTYWKRSVPPPNMAAFDAPNRETCTVMRPATTTPLQALVLLNDPQFVEAARAFAERILRQPGDDAARLRWAFEECTSRPPTDVEFAIVLKTLDRERAYYARNEQDAARYLSVGESLRDEAVPIPEHAAWSQVATLLLNLSEAVTRN